MTTEEMKAARDAAGVKTVKTFKDVFKGEATVVAIEPTACRWTEGLTEEEESNSFDISIHVSPIGNTEIGDQEITLPYSPRKRTFSNGNEATESDLALRELTGQKLIDNGEITSVFGAVGKTVQINVYDETSSKGTFRRCCFLRAKPKLSQAEVMRRITAMTGRKVTATATPAAPAQQKVVDNPFA